MNENISKILLEIADLLELKGVSFKPTAYRKASFALAQLNQNISDIYKEKGLKGIKEIKGIGVSISSKIEEYIKKENIKYLDELKEETAIQSVIAYFFKTKGVSLEELKYSAKRKKIIYSRYTKPAKQLLILAGSIEKAKLAIDKVSSWANSRNLDYAIETIFKKWLELDRLKPKEIVKKPFFLNNPMVWSDSRKKWYVISKAGEWLEFAGKEAEIEWKIV